MQSISDLEKIENLLNISSRIETVYTKLYKLEISNKKNTNKYKKLLQQLEKERKIEEQQYNQYELSYPKGIIWANLLITKIKKEPKNDMESIMKQKYNSCHIRRVINILTNQYIFKSDFIKQACMPEIIDFIKLRGIKELDIEKKTINDYLKILNEISKKPEYIGLKKRLMRAKYNLIFINKNIEDYMITNEFEITEIFSIEPNYEVDTKYKLKIVMSQTLKLYSDELDTQTTEYFKNHKIYNY